MLGTTWVAPGEGATIGQLQKAITSQGWTPDADLDLADAVETLTSHGKEERTDIKLTGQPLQDYDLARIAKLEVANA